MLIAFDRLFDRAATKLHVECSEEEKAEARRGFSTRFADALDLAAQITLDHIPDEVMQDMENAIGSLQPAQIAGHLAALPILHQTQEMIRTITYRAAEQRLIDHLITQADDRYGGN